MRRTMESTVRGVGRASLWIVCLFAAFVSGSFAAVINVNDTADVVSPGNGRCTLREAIDNANLPAGGDTTGGDCAPGDPGFDSVVLAAASYTLALPGSEDLNAAGDLDLLDDIEIAGLGPGATTIGAAGLDRVFDVDPQLRGIEVQLLGLTVTDGLPLAPAPGGNLRVSATAFLSFVEGEVLGGSAEQGGGLYNEGRTELSVVELRGNRAVNGTDGGGIHNLGEVSLQECRLQSNEADGSGGGVWNLGTLDMVGTVLEVNLAQDRGAGVFNGDQARIESSNFLGNESGGDGGGIYHDAGTLDGDELMLESNSAQQDGGGIYSRAGMELDNSQFLSNTAIRYGGGIMHVLGTAAVRDFSFDQNIAGEEGGAVRNEGTIGLRRGQMDANQAPSAGGGLFNAGVVALIDVTLDSNLSSVGAGAFNQADATFTGSTLSRNVAGLRGGGLYNDAAASSLLYNSTVSGNQSMEQGGGIFVDGTLRMEFSTITDNRSLNTAAGGLFNAADVITRHTVIADNAGDCGLAAAVLSLGYNLDSDGTCGLGGGIFDIVGGSANLGPLQNNGGLTRTHELQLPSDAIDSADPDCLDQFGVIVTEDQRGIARPLDGDGNGIQICDRGAFEAPRPFGPPPPVPNGIVGAPLTVGKLDPLGVDLALQWDVGLCPAQGYHLIYGDLADVSVYLLAGDLCGLSTSGSQTWSSSPAGSWWFVIVPDDAAQVEGSWGDASSGVRNGATPSGQCGFALRDNSGTCP